MYKIFSRILKTMKKIILLSFIIVCVCNAQQLKWSIAPKQMPYPVSGGQVVYDIASGSDKIYILGGYSDSLQSAVDWIQEYDAATDRWNMVGNMLQEREQFVAGLWKNNIWYFGGTTDASTDKNTIEIWDYKAVTNLPSVSKRSSVFGRSFSTGHIIDDNYYIIGGEPTNSSDTLAYIVDYNLNTKQTVFSFQSVSSSTLSQRMTFNVGNNIYIFGGVMNGVTNSIQRFNVQTQTLYDLTERLLEVRAAGAAVYNPLSKKGFIIGGYNEKDNSMSSVEQVELLSDSTLKITKIASLNYARTNLMAVAYKNGFVAVFGGRTDRKHLGKTVPYVELLVMDALGVGGNEDAVPKEFSLDQNYPNPFNPTTNVTFSVSKNASVSLDIYSVIGEHIVTLTSGDYAPGKYMKVWNAMDKFNHRVPSGVYFLKLRANNFIQTKKMVLLK